MTEYFALHFSQALLCSFNINIFNKSKRGRRENPSQKENDKKYFPDIQNLKTQQKTKFLLKNLPHIPE